MQSNKTVSLLFSAGKEKEGFPVIESKLQKAISYGADNIILLFLTFIDKEPSKLFLISRQLVKKKFVDINLYEAPFKEVETQSLCPAFEALLGSSEKGFVIGDKRNYDGFKKQYEDKTGKSFDNEKLVILANFLYSASQYQRKTFAFSYLSKSSGPIALFWIWYFSGMADVGLGQLCQSDTKPSKILDRIMLIDTVFLRYRSIGKLLTQPFETQKGDKQYHIPRCHITGDICRIPVNVKFTASNGESKNVYFEKEIIYMIVLKLSPDGHKVRFTWGDGVFELYMNAGPSRTKLIPTALGAVKQRNLALKAFKESFKLKFDIIQCYMNGKDAISLMEVYYSIFESFGFNRDLIPATSKMNRVSLLGSLIPSWCIDNVKAIEEPSRCLVM